MKLVQFECLVNVNREADKAERENRDVVAIETHTIWINPDDIQMVAPQSRKEKDMVFLFFKGEGGSTSVEGTFEEVVAKLTSE